MKSGHQNQLTEHHIIPKARGGNGDVNNILRVSRKKHAAFNLLFNSGDATPEEAVMILINEWWYKEPQIRDRKLHQLVMELAKLCSGYIDEQRITSLRDLINS